MKYTAIYREDWARDSRNYALVQMKRIETQEGETVADALKREGIYDSAQFLFVGHPPLQGENEVFKIDS